MSDGTLVGVFGAFNSRALVEVSAETAQELVGDELIDPAPAFVIQAVEGVLDDLRRRGGLADEGLAAVALSMAYELSSPGNSATSKAACGKVLSDALDSLRGLAPPEEKRDGVDDLTRARRERLERLAGGRPGS